MRINYIQGHAVGHGLWKNDIKTRLWKKDIGKWAGTIPHEHLELHPNAKLVFSKAIIHHLAYENSTDLILKSEQYARLAAKRYQSKSILSLVFSILVNPIFKFIKGYVLLLGFSDGASGWLIAKVSFQETYSKYFYALKSKLKKN